ncbi:EAL domain-containing protein [Oceanicoccus sagamiensis]|uniref:Two-component system response regulator n=1 Tax=Oceanicoccus sagamiensis TaxID=716816 RepID=A0A1X9N9D3_9GAMM|nr:EAL domain-containing protein [Oceanicoccus sagamiensis]ARN73042.1 two-component system response regulator [Oceanicoccus sagamiensis]
MSTAEAINNNNRGEARILLADDDPRMLDSLSSLLRLYDYQVETALGGQNAINRLSSDQFDLVLLDLKMPNVTGHDVMNFMSQNNINTMTIVVSGETSMDDISKALRHGAYDYLKKPYVPEELTATVNNAVRKKLLEKSNQLMQSRLNQSERLHRFIVNNSPDIIFILDNKGHFSFLNSKIEALLGHPKGSLTGQHITSIVEDDELEKINYFFENSVNTSGIQTIETVLKSNSANDSTRHFELSLYPIEEDDNGNLNTNQRYRIYGTARDITERMEAEAFINFQAYHDLLTRLPNRALFKDRLSVAITQAQRNNTELAVMFIDLDRFKIINDSLGHTMGDRLLQSVAQRLQACIRKGDTLSRFGGDEFTLLLPEVKNADAAVHIAEKILADIKKPFQLGNREVFIGASIGIAIYPESGEDMDALIKNADIAMYRVKKTGKDGYQLFNSEMHNASTERLMLEQDMRRAIDEDEFEICYQPQVDTATQKICGVEALIRWNHPDLGRLSPVEFIHVAEDSRLIVEIDKHTLRKACREVRHYHRNGMPTLRLAVNLSPVMIEKDTFIDDILTTLKEEQYPPGLLELEITENILMNDQKDVIEKLLRLANEGINLAIDDFGTGYSSLSYLQNFPVNTLKIDRSFISEIKNSDDNACIVNAIVSMAKGLKMSIVAEGVENHEQYSYLNSLGCDVVQGYLFGHATSLNQLAQQFSSDLALLQDASIS